MSKKSGPNLYSNLVYKMGQDFLDRQYKRKKWFVDQFSRVEFTELSVQ